MTPLEQLRANQHNDIPTPADAALSVYLDALDIETVRLDLAPHTATEARMLGRSNA
jgi:hypothetical protein